jgi:hypothetical protein
MLVDRSADHHHDVLGGRDRGRVGRRHQAPLGDGGGEQGRRALLGEGELPGVHQIDDAGVDVVQRHREASGGERHTQR